MDGSVNLQSVHHWSISPIIRYTAIELFADINGPQRMNPNYFGYPLSLLVASLQDSFSKTLIYG